MAATADRVVQGADEDNTWRIGEVVDIWDEDYLTAIRNLKNPYAYGYPAHYADRWYGSEDSKAMDRI
jgi:Zn-dependent metalloprotease